LCFPQLQRSGREFLPHTTVSSSEFIVGFKHKFFPLISMYAASIILIDELATHVYRDEIQRIKASNPDITHREAFSAAAKNVTPLSFSSNIVHIASYSHKSDLYILTSIFPSVYTSVGPFPTHPFWSHARSGPEEEPYAKSGKILRRINPSRNSQSKHRYAAWATLIFPVVLCRRELNACFSRTVSTQQQQPRPRPPPLPQLRPAWAFLHSDFTPHRVMIYSVLPLCLAA